MYVYRQDTLGPCIWMAVRTATGLSVKWWVGNEWAELRSTEDLLAPRAWQLEVSDEYLLEAAANLRDSRTANKKYFEAHPRRRPGNQALDIGGLVLLHNTQLNKQWSTKLGNR